MPLNILLNILSAMSDIWVPVVFILLPDHIMYFIPMGLPGFLWVPSSLSHRFHTLCILYCLYVIMYLVYLIPYSMPSVGSIATVCIDFPGNMFMLLFVHIFGAECVLMGTTKIIFPMCYFMCCFTYYNILSGVWFYLLFSPEFVV